MDHGENGVDGKQEKRVCTVLFLLEEVDAHGRKVQPPLMSEKEPNASKRSSSFRLEFRTPNSSPGPYPKSDDKNLRYLYDESRSPRYTQKYSRNGGHIKSPIQIEVVDDRYKDDERRNRRLPNIEAKLKKTSSDDLKKVETVAAPWLNTATEPLNRHKRPTTTTHKAASPNLAPNPQTAVNEPTKQRRREHHKIVETTTTSLIQGTSTMGKEREGELETRKGEGNWGNSEYMGTNTEFENLNYCGHYRRPKTLGMLCHQLMTLVGETQLDDVSAGYQERLEIPEAVRILNCNLVEDYSGTL
ncbi:hypothetical protein LR48_Vigan04g077200 [Vigna angularis]|uniref:Uncharacterized protein n=1 Tax=Phaseolus angularis TaxID=3914 RepID=A0A0L9UDG9_PHAAN|nr:hypothetical protein LR48_Vigan04g077200 [Vigna angularis]